METCFFIVWERGITDLSIKKASSEEEALVGRDGFEPSKSLTTDLQSVPFGRSGIFPYVIVILSVVGGPSGT